MDEYVWVAEKRHRGWPWPKDSWGLTPMFGEDGWCHACGVPRHPQTASMILQSRGIKVQGAWVPNWQFDVICMEASVAEAAAARFDLDLLKVEWHGTSPGDAWQIRTPIIGDAWFDPDELREQATRQHGVAGATCQACGTWRWMPLVPGHLPPLRITPGLGDTDIAASPEWFGDGWKAFRQIVMRRALAEAITAANPRDWEIVPVSCASATAGPVARGEER